jgi:hypothetical protein
MVYGLIGIDIGTVGLVWQTAHGSLGSGSVASEGLAHQET